MVFTGFQMIGKFQELVKSDILRGINIVKKPGNIDPCDDDPDVLRAELSCGHITGPQTLTDYCRYQLIDGKAELRCPLCNEQWSYTEVRKLAKLTPEEQQYFEETLANNATRKIIDIKNQGGLFPGGRCFHIMRRVALSLYGSGLCVLRHQPRSGLETRPLIKCYIQKRKKKPSRSHAKSFYDFYFEKRIMSSDDKRYDGSEKDITFVKMCCDIDPYDDDPNVLRAKLSCGHITGPQTLTDYCRVQLDQGKPELSCPKCKKLWSYIEVRKLAKLTPEEQQYFEENLAKNATRKIADIKN
ncbi:hypothetical protein QQF64_018725, partial [Cirrhinus molitorella]